jgi:cyclopropane fatty-acyl-phospholipid synthase-like methyltransferase
MSDLSHTATTVDAATGDSPLVQGLRERFLSCKKWAENLEAKRDEVIARWGRHLYRRFVLYLWSAANSFENGTLSAHHMILQLPSPGSAPRAALESWS